MHKNINVDMLKNFSSLSAPEEAACNENCVTTDEISKFQCVTSMIPVDMTGDSAGISPQPHVCPWQVMQWPWYKDGPPEGRDRLRFTS